MSLVFSGGNDYLIGAADGKTIAKNKFYVTKIVVPKQLPDSTLARVIDETLTICQKALTIAVVAVFVLGIYYNFAFQ